MVLGAMDDRQHEKKAINLDWCCGCRLSEEFDMARGMAPQCAATTRESWFRSKLSDIGLKITNN